MADIEERALAFLEKSIKQNKVFIDTCSILSEQANKFWEHAVPILQREGKHIIVPNRVYEEVVKFADHPELCAQKNSNLNQLAKEAVNTLGQLRKAHLIEVYGDPTDNFADNVFQTVFTQYRMKYDLMLITQDHNLAAEIDQIGKSKAVKSPHRIQVELINRYGFLSRFTDDTQTNEAKTCRPSTQNKGRYQRSAQSGGIPDEERFAFAKEVEKVNKEVQEIVGTEGWSKARFLFLGLIMRLRQLCIDPRIVYENYTDESSKMENLVKVVKDAVANEHKILIFSSFKTALDLANSSLNNEGITTYMLDGSVSAKKRMQLVDNFNNDNTNVFLIMLKAGGTGLNLTSADIVIHLDLWWNPQAENQATDRAHRIGQKNNVEVVKLVALGTIEEKILELQEKKKMLSDKLIEGDTRDQNVIEKLTEEDLKYLISYEQEE